MKIFKILKANNAINKNQNPQNLKELSELIQYNMGLFDEETGEYEGIDFHHSDWEIRENEYGLYGVPGRFVSIELVDDYEFIPTILGKQYSEVSSLEEASDLILEVLQEESDEDQEEYSEKSMEEVFQKNIKNMPRTEYWPHAGYILTNGDILDFSGGGSHRSKDHRAIFDGSTYGMQSFMIKGNIRVDVSQKMNYAGIDIYTKPTPSQYNTLRRLFRDMSKMNGEIQLDLSNGVEEFDEINKLYYMKDRKSLITNPYGALGEIQEYYENY